MIDEQVKLRWERIIEILNEEAVRSQSELVRKLRQGQPSLRASQSTVQRDLAALGVSYDYSKRAYVLGLPPRSGLNPDPPLATISRMLLQSVKIAQNLVLLRTGPGRASAIAVALDSELEREPEAWTGIVGTIAGDDTILIIAKNNREGQRIEKRFRGYLES